MKILIIYGGASFEHDVSLKSCKTIYENIDKDKFDVSLCYIDHFNNWFMVDDKFKVMDKITNILEYLKTFDKVFPVIHGNMMEDGMLPGLFKMFNIPYIGSSNAGSVISYNKDFTKKICDSYNIKQVPYTIIKDKKKIKKLDFDFPVIVKPCRCGSSIGINVAHNIKELNKYIKEAFKYDNKVIIEKFIGNALELECAVIDNNRKIIVTNVGMIISCKSWYDYDAKYILDSKTVIPAPISLELKNKVQELTYKIFDILELKDLARVDFLYDKDLNILYFNEVNTMPGFTSISMYLKLCNDIGIKAKDLITILLKNK